MLLATTISDFQKEKYFCEGGLDDPNQLESAHENRVYAHPIFVPLEVRTKRRAVKIELICPSGQNQQRRGEHWTSPPSTSNWPKAALALAGSHRRV
jgi:hypothetical protein